MESSMTSKKHDVLMAAAMAAVLCVPGAALAHGGGGMGGGHGGMGMSMGAHGGMGMGSMHGGFGGQSASHISARGIANTNGPNATARSFGTDRASLRSGRTFGANGSTRAGSKLSPNGGQSASHISANGLANTNGPNATARAFGKDRAAERANLKNNKTPSPSSPQ
jgi:hypothetical protein